MANESSVLVRLRLLGASGFARDANMAGRGLGSLDKSGKRVSSRFAGVSSTLGKAAAAMRVMGAAAGVAGAAGIAKGVSASVNFEQSMANVQARLLTTKANMGLLSDQAIQLGGKTAFSAGQAADAMGEFAAAGFNTRAIMAAMPGTLNLAAASGTDLAFAAETTGSLLRQFGLRSRDAGHLADVMTVAVNKSAINMEDLSETMKYVGPVAGRFNQSVEDIGASAAILGNVGIKGSQAGTTLRRAFVNIVKPSVRTQNVLEELGISQGEFAKATVDASGKLRPFPKMLGNLSGHFSKLTAPEQRRGIAQLFGVEALPGMLTLMGKGEKGINKMSNALTHSQGAAKRTAQIMRGTVKGAWDQFTGSLETASIKLTKRFLPVLSKGLKGAGNLVTGLTAGLSGETGGGGAAKVAGGPRDSGVQAGAKAQASGAQKAGLAIRSAIGGVGKFAAKVLPKIGSALADAGRQLIDAFKPAMPFVSNVLLPLLKGIAIGVIGGVVAAFKVVVPIIKVFATVLGAVGKVAAPFKGVIQGIGTVIGFVLGGPILKALGTIPKLGIVFKVAALPIKALGPIFKVVTGVIRTAVGTFLKVHLAALRFVSTFVSAPAKLARAALNIVGSVIHVIETMPGKVLGLAKSVGTKLVSGIAGSVRGRLGDLAGFFGRVGKSIIDWMVKAIKSAPGAIKDALLSVVPGPVKGAVSKAIGLAKHIPGVATGGVISRGGLAVVGERGPELAHLPSGSTVYDSMTSRRAGAKMAGGGALFLTANLHLSGKQIHSEVFRVERAAAEVS